MRKVLYLSLGTEAGYDLLRQSMPPGYTLVTLLTTEKAELLEKIRDVEVVIVGAQNLIGELIGAASRLRLVHHQGVGYQDTVDMKALLARGIPLAVMPTGTAAVAEHTVLLILATLRRLCFADSELRAGRWHTATLRPVSRSLAQRTVGYLGMGRIGQAVAGRLKSFETQGIYFSHSRLKPEREMELNLQWVSFADLLSQSDIVTLHLPATPGTRHLIGVNEIAIMKRGAFLINTSRGSLIDEKALFCALAGGHLAGAGLDVFEAEPPLDSPLLALPNVTVTPHIAAGTCDTLMEKMKAIFANIDGYFRGEPLANRVDGPAS
jgi:phosphoglycerate dehydrogenase-like enzyme